jgi:hypothetical protein
VNILNKRRNFLFELFLTSNRLIFFRWFFAFDKREQDFWVTPHGAARHSPCGGE